MKTAELVHEIRLRRLLGRPTDKLEREALTRQGTFDSDPADDGTTDAAILLLGSDPPDLEYERIHRANDSVLPNLWPQGYES